MYRAKSEKPYVKSNLLIDDKVVDKDKDQAPVSLLMAHLVYRKSLDLRNDYLEKSKGE